VLEAADISYPPQSVVYDDEFRAACYDEGLRRGLDIEGHNLFNKLMRLSSDMSYIYFPNLRHDQHHAVLMALVTYMWFYLDDEGVIEEELENMKEFSRRFYNGQKQLSPVLDQYAALTHELANYYSGMAYELMITGCVTYVAGVLLEYETKDEKFSPDAEKFPTFMRCLTSAGLCIFVCGIPPSVHPSEYIQAFPDLVAVNNHFTDIFSFYKEELVSEEFNRISHLSRAKGIPKLDVLHTMADDAAAAVQRILRLVDANPVVKKHLHDHFQGIFVGHLSVPRYRFKEFAKDLCPV